MIIWLFGVCNRGKGKKVLLWVGTGTATLRFGHLVRIWSKNYFTSVPLFLVGYHACLIVTIPNVIDANMISFTCRLHSSTTITKSKSDGWESHCLTEILAYSCLCWKAGSSLMWQILFFMSLRSGSWFGSFSKPKEVILLLI